MSAIKELLTTLALTLLLGNAFAQVSAGGGLAYGTDLNDLGIQVHGGYQINEEWRGFTSFIYYLDGIENISFWELNFNGHYFFVNDEKAQAFALAGLNIINVGISIDLGFLGQVNESSTEVGLNIGVGGQYALAEKLKAIATLKYAISSADQLVLSAGVLFDF